MLSLNVKGTLGKFGYEDVPDAVVDQIIQAAGLQALKTAIANAPYLPEHEIHLKENIHSWWDPMARVFYVIAASIYANIAEFGSRMRLPHPYMRKAIVAAKNKMKSVIRGAFKKAIKEVQARAAAIRRSA
jgi:HK97 gp10 family phage protein